MANKLLELPTYDVIHDRVSSEIPETPVSEIMVEGFVRFRPDDNLSEANKILISHKLTGAPVVSEENKLLGFLSEKDCLRAIYEARYHNTPPGPVRAYMTRNVMAVNANTDVFDVVDLFLRNHFHSYPVLNNDIVVGVISRSNVLKAIFEK